MPQIEPFVTIAQIARQTVAEATRQPQPSVRSVHEASSSIMQDIIRPVGDTVGVLTFSERSSQGAFKGAGLHSGISVVV